MKKSRKAVGKCRKYIGACCRKQGIKTLPKYKLDFRRRDLLQQWSDFVTGEIHGKEEVAFLRPTLGRGFAEVYLVGDKLIAGHHTEVGYQLLISPRVMNCLKRLKVTTQRFN